MWAMLSPPKALIMFCSVMGLMWVPLVVGGRCRAGAAPAA